MRIQNKINCIEINYQDKSVWTKLAKNVENEHHSLLNTLTIFIVLFKKTVIIIECLELLAGLLFIQQSIINDKSLSCKLYWN